MLFLCGVSVSAHAAAPAGYTKYYIPGDEDEMYRIFSQFGATGTAMHTIITITAWADNTTVYYDHWEDGYDFDPDNPLTADETVVLASSGDFHTFSDPGGVPIPLTGAGPYYDGRDIIYVAGGATTVSRTSWIESVGPTQSIAWEVYPVKPQLTAYILPFGEDLSSAPKNLTDFSRVFVLIQATGNGTIVTVDLDGDGTPDQLDQNRDGDCADPGDTSTVTLNDGEVFLLDDADGAGGYQGSLCPGDSLDTGATINASNTLQVQYVIGSSIRGNYEVRGFSAFPRGLWDDEYYAPVDGAAAGNTDIYLHNPHATSLTIDYETSAGSGMFVIAAGDTVSFQAETGSYVPQNSGVYFKGSDVFWGISSVDAESRTYDWGYSLVPSFLLEDEHFMGWAPGSYPVTAGDYEDSGIFVTPARDNTTIFVDLDNDGTADLTYLLNRLDSQYVWDNVDGDLSGAHIWGTGPYSMAYGQNADIAPPASPAIDVGYTTIPGTDFVNSVLQVTKTANPVIVPTAVGSQTTYTIVIDSFGFSMDNIIAADTLPAGWQYVAGSATITLADKSLITGAAADPAIAGSVLTWSAATLGSMAENQQIIITFTAQIDGTVTFSAGDLTRNFVEVAGTRTVGGITQTFTTTDSAFNSFGDMTVTKASSGIDPLYPGDRFTYTVTVSNPITAASDLTGINIYDPLPAGTGYVAGSSQVSAPQNPLRITEYYIGTGSFVGNTYDLTLNQDLAADYFVIIQGSDGSGGSTGNRGPDENYAALTADPFGTGDLALSGATDVITLSRGNSVDGWVGVVTVVEALGDQSGSGFSLLDVQRVAHTGTTTSGSDISGTSWTDVNQVMLMGGFNGAGCDTAETGRANQTVCFARIWPSGTNTINWTRDNTVTTLSSATSTVMVVEWGADWGVQRVNVTGANGGNGADATGEYNTAAIIPVARDNTWVWGTGHTDDNGLGDGAEGVLVTLGDGVNQNASETLVAVATEYGGTAIDFEVYALTHADLAVDYRFKADGDTADLTVDVPVDSATSNRMALAYNGQNGTGTAYPRPMFSARYLSDTTVRLERRRSGQAFPAWIQGIDFSSIYSQITTPAGNQPNFVSSGDGFVLQPGQSLVLTFDVTVDDPLDVGIASITNVASANTNEITLPVDAQVTNIVVNPSSGSGTVGNRIWLDTDGNGSQDAGEGGLANVTVVLRDLFGTPVATAITDSNGYYLFSGVPPGAGYYVEVTGGLPAGLAQSAPAGRSDDRTDAFNLAAGQTYSGANIGYAPSAGTATLGNLVWSDADGNGTRDVGEPGLSGVTVRIYLDTGDGIFDPAVDTLVDTTASAADGSYLFTGITASGTEDYFVYVDETQAALSGYTATTGASPLNVNVNGGDVLLNNDFGFQPPAGSSFTIQDRVWYDANADGSDTGESGIAGVTVVLLDGSRNVVATAITDSNGNFSFAGVPGSGNYTVRISDTGGVLANYYGTTASAVAGEFDIVNLSADTTGIHFGYNLSATIGDTVFNDLDGNGIRDAGEPGIGGITVDIYTDTDGDGQIGAGDTLQATLTTGSDGSYLFTGLADGDYIISIASPPSGYTFTGTDSDPGSAGDQLAASVSSGSTSLDTDFGYLALVPRTVSGTIWDDTNSDGVIDPSETGMAGVTVELQQGGATIASTTTDSGGSYSFTGIPSGIYTVVLTDTLGILNGYDPTFEKSVGTGGPFDNQEAADLTGGDLNDIHFGFNKPVPTLAVISGFRALNESGRMVLEWNTASEVGTVGFYLQRFDRTTGRFVSVNKKILPGLLHSPQGGVYRYVDEGVTPGPHTYRLVEVEMGGGERLHGPFSVNPVAVSSLRVSSVAGFSLAGTNLRNFTSAPRALKQAKKRVFAAQQKARSRTGKKFSRPTRLKFSTQSRGLHYISAAEIASGLARPEKLILRKIDKGHLQLTNRGQVVRTWPGEDGLYFFAEKTDSVYTGDNVYRLRLLKKRSLNRRQPGSLYSAMAPPVPVDNQTYIETAHSEKDNWALTALFNDPEADYWLWDYVFAGYGSKSFPVSSPGVSADGRAGLTVYFQGATDTPGVRDHHALIRINGYDAGETVWDGATAHSVTLEIDQWQLNEGENTVEIIGILEPGVPYSLFYVDSIDLRYNRYYRAVNNELYCRGDTNTTITVDNFTTPDIQVFDISNPLRPARLENVLIDEVAGIYRATFMPASPESEYLVTTFDTAVTVVDIRLDNSSFMKKKSNGADYVIIAPSEFMATAERLASFRELQGLRTMIVDLEDIYDAFSHGMVTPHAIRSFLRAAYKQWEIPPRYIVIAGNGTYDYKNNMGLGDNLVPPVMVATENGLFASDTFLADVRGEDGVPEMAIGRIPASDATEFAVFVNKMIDYELASAGPWMRRVTLLADNPDEGGNFTRDSDQMADLAPAGSLTEKIYLGDQTLANARALLRDSLNQGSLLVNYIGHAGLDRLATEGLLTSDDVPGLVNAERLPFMAAMTCIAGRFEIPGFDTLAKKLLFLESGGINGLWGSTGYSYNDQAVQLNRHLFNNLFTGGQKRVGDSIRKALADQYDSMGGYGELLDIYNLLGDPAMTLH